MSYDIDLCDPITHEVCQLDQPHQMNGGTYAVGGTKKLTLNITYNYAHHYYRTMGEKGIRTIYGMTGEVSVVILARAMNQLKNDVSDDYWEPTEGNARRALGHLVIMATLRPDGIWQGD